MGELWESLGGFGRKRLIHMGKCRLNNGLQNLIRSIPPHASTFSQLNFSRLESSSRCVELLDFSTAGVPRLQRRRDGAGKHQARVAQTGSPAIARGCFALDHDLTQQILERFPLGETPGFHQPGQVFIVKLAVPNRRMKSNSFPEQNFGAQSVRNWRCRRCWHGDYRRPRSLCLPTLLSLSTSLAKPARMKMPLKTQDLPTARSLTRRSFLTKYRRYDIPRLRDGS